jgi:hypothetical protein
MKEAHERGSRGQFLYLSVGLGKTWIVLSYIKYLLEREELPDYIVYSLPASAIKSVAEEIIAFGLPVRLMIPLKGKKKVDVPKGVEVAYDCEPEAGVVNLIEHDHLKLCPQALEEVADQTFFVFDEVHKMLADTQRTSVALQISRLAREFVVLTGTPVIDNKIYRLEPWLEPTVAFEVTERNFWAAATMMVSRKASTGIKTESEEVEAKFTPEEEAMYRRLVPPALGGTAGMSRMEDLKKAVDLSYVAADREIVVQVLRMLSEGRGTMVVAATEEHQSKLRDALVKSGVKSGDIFLLGKGASLFLTDDAVAKGKVPPYKVVITTVRHSAGYTLTYLSAYVEGVYPSNQATREQLQGRINRLGSSHELLKYITVHCGLLTFILENHQQARSLSMALGDLAESVKAK